MLKKIRVGIIDDDQTAIDFLSAYIAKTDGLVKAFETVDPQKGLIKVKTGTIDLLIVDMMMANLSGIELIAQIKELQRPSRKSRLGMQVIICSGTTKYAAESYHYDVTDYMSKPVEYSRFIEAIDKAKQQWKIRHPMLIRDEQIFLVKVGHQYHQKMVRIDEIICLEADGMDCKLWFADDKLVVGKPMSYVVERLPRERFIRCHRSFVVNTDYIVDIFTKKIKMRYLAKEVLVGDRRIYKEFSLWEMSNKL
ncbi:LytR/AlgR family response regulator transcription factor [Sphingobacterium faecium]|uniref:LytR/AlgR family response regulator transcription factor n=1 Tax=Sphingobacterium faecium TaxID=34087 RepID=UPI0004E5F808|nr:LytTR family DNA-binding domain-containing protein [Sphingobacterium faecium]WGQ12887.1 LytTR family DNA-binding domain-containing protein [Sphingobacterium faecium]CDS91491.1 putative Two component transcriptional regulator, LytTR family [Sphingobacterium sp. PM2-P1-29]SJN51041.1 Two-component system response regulator protein [Sphingobacterium faecium PCAi_F2.5]HCU45918.1 DNA-binding response regulator [Sphingobacterium sp.]